MKKVLLSDWFKFMLELEFGCNGIGLNDVE